MAMTDRAESPATADRRTVAGVFEDPDHAEQALNDLRAGGFAPEQVSVLARDTRAGREMVAHTGMGAETAGAGTGAFLGGITGGILGWLLGIGALAIPGIGPVVAAGALATTLGGAAIGALAGGLVGGLVAMGIPEEEARGYEASVHAGRILLAVSANDDAQAQQAQQVFHRHEGADVRAFDVAQTGSEAGTTTSTDTTTTATGSSTATEVTAETDAPESTRRGDLADGSEGSATGSRTPA